MSSVRLDGIHIGTVAKFAGEPKATSWMAWSIHRIPDELDGRLLENSKQFPTRKAAVAWLTDEHTKATP